MLAVLHLHAGDPELKRDLSDLRLIQTAEDRVIKRGFQIPKRDFAARRDPVDAPLFVAQDRRGRGEMKRYIRDHDIVAVTA